MYDSALQYLQVRTAIRPRLAVVLGSGLGGFTDELTDRVEIPYRGIPGWPQPTAAGHSGKLVFGRIDGRELAVMAGRAHLYEGYTPQQVVFGVRVLGKMGVRGLVLTNAAGALNLSFERGSLVLISDHINLQGTNPLVGPNDDNLGPRFPDMSEVYSLRYRMIAREVASELGLHLKEGVYAAVLGPNYETPAEIRFLHTIGADLVGMSTVPEAIAAVHMGMKVLGLSVVSNLAAGLSGEKLTHEEVLDTGKQVQELLSRFLKALIPRLEV